MSFEFIAYETRDRVAYITINRPDRLNAVHPPASVELRAAFTDFRDNPDALVAVLTGAGVRAFCAGNDLKYQAEQGASGQPYPGADETPFGGITSDFTSWKPIIAAVNGYAMGGGLELVLACDLAVASEGAVFGMPETRVGLVAAAGGVHRLPRQLPWKIAMGMLLAAKTITAQEALRWGLVNEVVPQDQLADAAQRLAGEIVKGAPLSVRATKQMSTIGLDLPLDEAMSRSYDEYERAIASEDFLEGPRAFAEKRPPRWKGR